MSTGQNSALSCSKKECITSPHTEILWKVFYSEYEQLALGVMCQSCLVIEVPYYRRFNLWLKKGVLMRVFSALRYEHDLECEFIDASIVKAHQHSTDARKENDEGIGKSVAGNTTKINMAVDSYGLAIEFYITGGEVHDSKAAPTLIDRLPSSDYIIADLGYESEVLREQIRDKNAIPVIPRKKNSKVGTADSDWCLYKYRHLVENVFARIGVLHDMAANVSG